MNFLGMNIQQYQIKVAGGRRRQPQGAIRTEGDLVSALGQEIMEMRTEHSIIFDDQQTGGNLGNSIHSRMIKIII